MIRYGGRQLVRYAAKRAFTGALNSRSVRRKVLAGGARITRAGFSMAARRLQRWWKSGRVRKTPTRLLKRTVQTTTKNNLGRTSVGYAFDVLNIREILPYATEGDEPGDLRREWMAVTGFAWQEEIKLEQPGDTGAEPVVYHQALVVPKYGTWETASDIVTSTNKEFFTDPSGNDFGKNQAIDFNTVSASFTPTQKNNLKMYSNKWHIYMHKKTILNQQARGQYPATFKNSGSYYLRGYTKIGRKFFKDRNNANTLVVWRTPLLYITWVEPFYPDDARTGNVVTGFHNSTMYRVAG